MEPQKIAIIIGAGPAGLTAARELIERTDIKPVILEQSEAIGGLSQTVNYKGNRLDIGGHRFFSKSDRVMNWWLDLLPPQGTTGRDREAVISYQKKSRPIETASDGPDPNKTDRVMLIRKRLSRIYHGRKFYDYPVRLNANTLRNLGLVRISRIGLSYLWARLRPVKNEKSLEDFFINRFGKELYRTFFKDYTEKVWGVPCSQIKPEWGAQRIKGLSVTKALIHSLRTLFARESSIGQKKTETSLIEQFLYPKFGPGHLWQTVAEQIVAKGGQIRFSSEVNGLEWQDGKITRVNYLDRTGGTSASLEADYVFSTMPVRDLITGMGQGVPETVQEVASGLEYRDFITVGLLFRQMDGASGLPEGATFIPDNWIYVQESDVRVGRIQVFNNWSPYLVSDPATVWLGLEYFCQEGDDLWEMNDDDLIGLGVAELGRIGFCRPDDYLDGTVVRMPKTYPAYFGTYDRFGVIRHFTDSIDNLYLIGRNGMHRYNNQDHSMLTAMTVVDNLLAGITSKESVWKVNTEEEYHEG
ncbi:MAG: NAD(P)/FAD-dependent oxidoreductase [Bacteroidales bacterium]